MKSISDRVGLPGRRYGRALALAATIALLAAALYASSLHSYLLFHSMAELFSIVVAFAIFVVAWNARRIIHNNYLIVIGIAYLFIGFIDLLHTLGYEGMPLFPDHPYVANQLWLAARYMEGGTLLAAFSFARAGKGVRAPAVFIVYTLLTTALLSSIFVFRVFPVCFLPGEGQTGFKIMSEYVISFILAAAIVRLYRHRDLFDPAVFRYLKWSLVFSILSELAFSLYVSNYSLVNMAGHYAKIAGFYLVYKALIETGFARPFETLFREIKQNERRLESALKQKDLLLKEVHHRVKNNFNIVSSLIRLQAARVEDAAVADRLRDLTSRIQSMALVHEKLYRSSDLSNIDLGAYVREAAENLFGGYGVDRERIRCEVRSRDGIALTIRQAIPCGMIVNELVTNCLKYAFPGDRRVSIGVEVSLTDDGVVVLAIRDDGVGLPEGLDIEGGGTLGISLVRSLAEQISGSIEVGPGPGTSVVVRFPLGG